MSARICVVTAGHLSTCPRMLKAADALHGAGYRVRVVSANHTAWATAADRRVKASRGWSWTVVDYARDTAAVARLATGMRFKAANSVAAAIGLWDAPTGLVVRAYSRAHDEIVRAIAAEPADFVYGGTTGALAAVGEAAAAIGVPYGVDLEDFHSGEQSDADGESVHVLARRIERAAIDGARLVTASSPMISETYRRQYGVRPLTIHNTFSIDVPPDEGDLHEGPIRLYWFSQTIGPGRGLEDVIRAASRLGEAAELHLRGRLDAAYSAVLRDVQRDEPAALTLVHHDPAPPDDMVRLAQGYDVGLSCEEPSVFNRRVCLTNKIFTYLAAGVPVVMSRTPAQAALADDLGSAAATYECGDVEGLASALRHCAADPERRRLARGAARAAAERRWHWQHPADRGALLTGIARAIR
jgi:glycosyltransferase involved in cell wall biosynthesis